MKSTFVFIALVLSSASAMAGKTVLSCRDGLQTFSISQDGDSVLFKSRAKSEGTLYFKEPALEVLTGNSQKDAAVTFKASQIRVQNGEIIVHSVLDASLRLKVSLDPVGPSEDFVSVEISSEDQTLLEVMKEQMGAGGDGLTFQKSRCRLQK